MGAKLPVHPFRRVVRGGLGLTVLQVNERALQTSIRYERLSICIFPAGWKAGKEACVTRHPRRLALNLNGLAMKGQGTVGRKHAQLLVCVLPLALCPSPY